MQSPITRKPIVEEENLDKSGSSNLSEEELVKGLKALELFSGAADPSSRKDTLLKKALSEELASEEKQELFDLIGEDKASPSLEPVSKGMEENKAIQDSLDVSDFLSAQHTELVKALDSMESRIGTLNAQQNEFNLLLAKGITSIGKCVQNILNSIDTIESAPCSAPKATNPKALAKSFSGSSSEDAPLTKSLAAKTLLTIVENRMSKGLSTVMENGIDLANEVALIESSGRIHPDTVKLIEANRI